MGYSKNFIIGISWVSILRISVKLLSLIKIIVLARILSQSQFGAFSIAFIVYGFSTIITETGVNTVLVQNNESLSKYINTAWVITITRGFVVFICTLLSAPLISHFFNIREVYSLIILISLVPLIQGFINPAEILFQKNMLFKKELSFRIIINILEVIFTIMFVYITKNATGLAYGLILGALIEVFLSMFYLSPKPKFIFNKKHARMIIHKGKWITYAGIFSYLYQNIDNLIVGKFLGASSLGLYDLIYKVSMIPLNEITDVFGRVSFPIYIKISNDASRLKKAFLKSTVLIIIIIFPVSLVCFFFPKEVLTLLLGEKWQAGSQIFQIFAGFGIIRALSNSTSAFFMGLGKQKYAAILSFISLFTLLVIIFIAINNYGLVGVAVSVITSSFIVLLLSLFFVSKTLSGLKLNNEKI